MGYSTKYLSNRGLLWDHPDFEAWWLADIQNEESALCEAMWIEDPSERRRLVAMAKRAIKAAQKELADGLVRRARYAERQQREQAGETVGK